MEEGDRASTESFVLRRGPKPDLLSPNMRRILGGAVAAFGAWRLWLIAFAKTGIRVSCDGGTQWNMAVNLVQGRGLFVSDASLLRCVDGTLGPNHHYGPFMSILEAGFVALFGDTDLASKLFLIALFVGVAASLWWTTRDLLGRDAALVATAWVMSEGTLLLAGFDWGYADPLIVALMAWTLWAILRSLEDPPFILLAGLFAALGYLTKSSVGWFFVIAGGGGIAWRLLHRGRGAILNGWYLGAVGIFGAIVAAWVARNLALFWDGTLAGLARAAPTSPYNDRAFVTTFLHPSLLAKTLAIKFPMVALQVALVAVPLWPELRRAAQAWRQERVSLLWLSAGLLFLIGWLFAAASFAVEQGPLLWPDPMRYIVPVSFCLVWLALAFTGRRIPLARWALAMLLAYGMMRGLYWIGDRLPVPWGGIGWH